MSVGITLGQLADWPVYVNDEGVVSCHHPECGEDPWTPAAIGRRTAFKAVMDALAEHMRVDHGVECPL